MVESALGTSRRDGPRVIIIVPAFNEAASVGEVIREIREAVPGAVAVVINDGSRDATSAAARLAGARVVELPFNSGIGTAVQTGFRIAAEEGFDLALQVDGDGQHPPDQVPILIDTLLATGSNYVIGSRFADATGYRSSLARRGGIVILAKLVSAVSRQKVTDTTSGFRAADQSTIRLFAEHYPHDYPEVEAIVLARRAGLKVTEVPVRMRNRESGRSSITPFRSAYYMVKVGLAVLVQCMGRNPIPDEKR